MFKKICYECGEKTNNLYEGKCKVCYKSEKPPIIDLKPINLKYCNKCKRIFYNNMLYTSKEIKEKIEDIVKKNITIDPNYELKDLKVKNFEILGSKVNFDIEIDADLKRIGE